MNSIILATEMGSVPLLPTSRSKLLIESAIDFCTRHLRYRESGYKESITVVVPLDSPIPHALQEIGFGHLLFASQHDPSYGIVDAMFNGSLMRLNGSQPLLIAFADEMYTEGLTVDDKNVGFYGSTSTNPFRDVSWVTIKADCIHAYSAIGPLHQFLKTNIVRFQPRDAPHAQNLRASKDYIKYLSSK